MTAVRAWLATLVLGSRCDICGDRVRGWRTLMVHRELDHAGD